MHIISHQFTNSGNMYTSFMVVVVVVTVALVITVGRHVWHYVRSICLTSVHFLLIGHGCVNSTACVLNHQSLGIQLIRMANLINPSTFTNTHKPKQVQAWPHGLDNTLKNCPYVVKQGQPTKHQFYRRSKYMALFYILQMHRKVGYPPPTLVILENEVIFYISYKTIS